MTEEKLLAYLIIFALACLTLLIMLCVKCLEWIGRYWVESLFNSNSEVRWWGNIALETSLWGLIIASYWWTFLFDVISSLDIKVYRTDEVPVFEIVCFLAGVGLPVLGWISTGVFIIDQHEWEEEVRSRMIFTQTWVQQVRAKHHEERAIFPGHLKDTRTIVLFVALIDFFMIMGAMYDARFWLNALAVMVGSALFSLNLGTRFSPKNPSLVSR